MLAMLRLLPVLRDPSVALKEQLWTAASWHSQDNGAGNEKGGGSSSSSLRAEEVLALYLCSLRYLFLSLCTVRGCLVPSNVRCPVLHSLIELALTHYDSPSLSHLIRCGALDWKYSQARMSAWRA